MKTANIHLHSQWSVLFSDSGEQSGEVDEPINTMFHNQFSQSVSIHDVSKLEVAKILYSGIGFLNVSHDNRVLTIFGTRKMRLSC